MTNNLHGSSNLLNFPRNTKDKLCLFLYDNQRDRLNRVLFLKKVKLKEQSLFIVKVMKLKSFYLDHLCKFWQYLFK